jgi:hypothetical protein
MVGGIPGKAEGGKDAVHSFSNQAFGLLKSL